MNHTSNSETKLATVDDVMALLNSPDNYSQLQIAAQIVAYVNRKVPAAPSDEVIEAIKARQSLVHLNDKHGFGKPPQSYYDINTLLTAYEAQGREIERMKEAATKRQDRAEEVGERFRPYLDMAKIQRRIDRPRDPCGSMKGSDGYKMLPQEFIGDLVRPILDELDALRTSEAELQVEKANLLRLLDSESQGRASTPQEREQYIRDVARIREEVRAEFGTLLKDIRSALVTLPKDALGLDSQGGWSYRDELISNVDKALPTPVETA